MNFKQESFMNDFKQFMLKRIEAAYDNSYDSERQRLRKIFSALFESVKNELSQEGQEKLFEIEEISNKLAFHADEEIYKIGLKDGIKLYKELEVAFKEVV